MGWAFSTTAITGYLRRDKWRRSRSSLLAPPHFTPGSGVRVQRYSSRCRGNGLDLKERKAAQLHQSSNRGHKARRYVPTDRFVSLHIREDGDDTRPPSWRRFLPQQVQLVGKRNSPYLRRA